MLSSDCSQIGTGSSNSPRSADQSSQTAAVIKAAFIARRGLAAPSAAIARVPIRRPMYFATVASIDSSSNLDLDVRPGRAPRPYGPDEQSLPSTDGGVAMVTVRERRIEAYPGSSSEGF